MSSLATLRAAVQADLKDLAEATWTDAEIDRHIARANQEYSQYNPLEVKSTLETETDSREVDISTLTPRIRLVAAEYPTGEYPPQFVPFTQWAEVLTLDLAEAPADTPDVNIFWHKEHTIHATVDASTTFPSNHDHIICTGAAAYAALEWAAYASNRVNVGGDNTWGRYMDFANKKLADFHAQLRKLPAVSRVKSSRMYTADDVRLTSQTTDPGPV